MSQHVYPGFCLEHQVSTMGLAMELPAHSTVDVDEVWSMRRKCKG